MARIARPRIGLLTYHRSVNDGSIMQALCLYRLLEALAPGAEVEIIDYMPAALHRRHRRLAMYDRRPPFFNPRYVWSYREQQAFLRRRCRYSRRRLITDDVDHAQTFVDGLGYDAVVVGSDTCWEIDRDPPPPNIYFRPTRTTPSFAFAASADPVPDPATPIPNAGALRDALDRFTNLTVRDAATHDLVERLGIPRSRIAHLPDPTLLHDFADELVPPRLSGRTAQPLAAIAASPRLARAVAAEVVREGYQPVSLMGARQLPSALALPMLSTIRQRLGLYQALDLTVTDRFHMTIFALKHGSGPVVFLEDTARWPSPLSKGRDLLARLGLEAMVWRVDVRAVDGAALATRLAAWPDLAQGLDGRLRGLRAGAELSEYGGIGTSLAALARGRARPAPRLPLADAVRA